MSFTDQFVPGGFELVGQVLSSEPRDDGPHIYMDPSGVSTQVKVKRLNLTPGWKLSPHRKEFASRVLLTRMRDYTAMRSRILHRHIVQLIGFMFSNDDPQFIIHWCTYRSLPEYLQSRSHPANRLQVALHFVRQVANGLAYIHALDPPVHHGSLKPSEILVDDDDDEEIAKISDIGYQEFKYGLEETISLTQVETVGFAGYPAPELLISAVTSPAADIYALAGTILHVISESFPPYPDTLGVLDIVKGNKPARADHPGLPRDHPLWALLESMWTFNAEERPRAGKVQFAIQWILKHPTGTEQEFCEQCDVPYVPPLPIVSGRRGST